MKTMKTIKVKAAKIDRLNFMMTPRDSGQIVEVSYAADAEGLWCRTYDRSDRTTVYHFAPYRANATEETTIFEPWNGVLPKAINAWRSVAVVG